MSLLSTKSQVQWPKSTSGKMEKKKKGDIKGNDDANGEGNVYIDACESDDGRAGQDKSDNTVVLEWCVFFNSFVYACIRNGKKGYDFDHVKRWSRNKV